MSTEQPTGQPTEQPTEQPPGSGPGTSSNQTQPIKDTTMNLAPPSDPTMPFRVEPATPVPDDAYNPDAADAGHWGQPAAPPSSAPQAQQPPVPTPALVTVRTGPRPGTVLLGLLSILVAAFVVVRQTTDLTPNLGQLAPAIIAAVGVLLLLVGLTGVLLGRRHRD